MVEPRNFAKANKDDDWIKAMNEELDQVEKNQTWEIFPRPKTKNIVGTKWVFKKNFNEYGQVIRNIFPIARLEEIIMFFAYPCYRNFKVYKMDVKYAFLNGKLEEEVYIEQPEGFLLS